MGDTGQKIALTDTVRNINNQDEKLNTNTSVTHYRLDKNATKQKQKKTRRNISTYL